MQKVVAVTVAVLEVLRDRLLVVVTATGTTVSTGDDSDEVITCEIQRMKPNPVR